MNREIREFNKRYFALQEEGSKLGLKLDESLSSLMGEPWCLCVHTSLHDSGTLHLSAWVRGSNTEWRIQLIINSEGWKITEVGQYTDKIDNIKAALEKVFGQKEIKDE